MTAVRRLLLLLPVAAVLLLAGCGGSLATQSGSSRTTATTAPRATTPFCEAVQASKDAVQPVNGLGVDRPTTDVAAVAANVRRANQQVTALAPQEIRADFDRANQVVERQLELLEQHDGDTFAVARDPEIARARTDPAYRASTQRIADYVRSNCTA